MNDLIKTGNCSIVIGKNHYNGFIPFKDKNLRFKHAIWAEIYNWEERGFEFGKIAFHTDISLESAIQKVFNDVQCTRGCTILYINNKLIDEKKQKEILTKYSSPEIVERFFPKKPKRN